MFFLDNAKGSNFSEGIHCSNENTCSKLRRYGPRKQTISVCVEVLFSAVKSQAGNLVVTWFIQRRRCSETWFECSSLRSPSPPTSFSSSILTIGLVLLAIRQPSIASTYLGYNVYPQVLLLGTCRLQSSQPKTTGKMEVQSNSVVLAGCKMMPGMSLLDCNQVSIPPIVSLNYDSLPIYQMAI